MSIFLRRNDKRDANVTKNSNQSPKASQTSDKQFTDDVIAASNSRRKQHGVPCLRHNSELSKIAQKWAEHLSRSNTFEHSKSTYKGGSLGENLAMKWSSQPNYSYTGADAVEQWYSEIRMYTFGIDQPSNLSQVGHFTQLVWRGSTEVGVGRCKGSDGKTYVVANYNPPGNYRGEFRDNVPPPGAKSKVETPKDTPKTNKTPVLSPNNNSSQPIHVFPTPPKNSTVPTSKKNSSNFMPTQNSYSNNFIIASENKPKPIANSTNFKNASQNNANNPTQFQSNSPRTNNASWITTPTQSSTPVWKSNTQSNTNTPKSNTSWHSNTSSQTNTQRTTTSQTTQRTTTQFQSNTPKNTTSQQNTTSWQNITSPNNNTPFQPFTAKFSNQNLGAKMSKVSTSTRTFTKTEGSGKDATVKTVVEETIIYSVGRKEDATVKTVVEETITYSDGRKEVKTTETVTKGENKDLSPQMKNMNISQGAAAKPVKSQSPAEFQKEAVATHNRFRSKHGACVIKHSKDLEEFAQKWADNLAKAGSLKHSDCMLKGERLGENVACKSSSGSADYTGEEVVEYWYSEVAKHDFKASHPVGSGHFSQVVWKGSKEVGLGKAKSKDGTKVYVVGSYRPVGNVVGTFVENVSPAKK